MLTAKRMPWLMLLLLYYLVARPDRPRPAARPVRAAAAQAGLRRRLPRRGVEPGARRRRPNSSCCSRASRSNLRALLALGAFHAGGHRHGGVRDVARRRRQAARGARGQGQAGRDGARDRRGPAGDAVRRRAARLPVDPGDLVRAGAGRLPGLRPGRGAGALSLRCSLANWRPIAVYGALVFFFGGVCRRRRRRSRWIVAARPRVRRRRSRSCCPTSSCSSRRCTSATT